MAADMARTMKKAVAAEMVVEVFTLVKNRRPSTSS